MKKSEVSVVSSEEEDDAALSVDSSLLTSDTDQDYGSNFLLDSELSGDMQAAGDFVSTHPQQSTQSGDFILPLAEFGSHLPKDLEMRPGVLPVDITIWTRVELRKGKRFGPIPAQLKDGIPPISSVWKVVDEQGTVKAWVDTLIARGGQWTAFLRKSDRSDVQNVTPVFYGGQIYLEVIRDTEAGQELRLATYDIPLPQETSQRNGNLSPSSSLQIISTGQEESEQSRVVLSSSPSGNLKSPVQPPPLVPISEHGQLAIKDGPARCLACDLDFPDHYRLNEHIGNSHYSEDSGQGEREYKCSQCPKVFNWKSNLIRHQVAHDESRRYVCENCKKVFTDPSNLQRHIRSQHIGARSHACPECGKTFATSSGLKQHTHIHSSVKPFRCEVCFKAYTQFSNLCRHKRMHATCRMQIKCHKCGQAFSAVTSLSKHKRFCEGTTTSSSSSSASNSTPNFQVVTSITAPSYESEKTVPMSLAPPTNPLIFYPRPGFPLYPPSLFGYPLFSGASLPAPPPLIPDTSLLSGPGIAAAAAVAQDFQRQLLNCSNVLSAPNALSTSSKQELSASVKVEKHNSEASESEASEEVTSDTGGEDISSFSDGESETETVHSVSASPNPRQRTTTATSVATGLAAMFTNLRQDSPKQGSVCPDPALMTPVVSSNGLLRPLINNCAKSNELEMPFDLSRHNKSRISAEKCSEFHSKTRDDSKTEEPLDLRVSHKKSSPIIDENQHKTHIFGEKEKEREFDNPLLLPPVPEPLQHLEPKQESPPPPPSPTKLPMAYPRPIHPMFLESMYRLQQEKPAFNLFGAPERLMAPFPPRYPFMGPLLGTNPSFDFMRAHMEKVGKPMHDIISPHLNKSKERYSCKFCGKIFPRSANLTRHLRTHTGEQPYKCKYCERSFSISSNLQRHVRNIHNKEKPFKCPLCDRCFGQQTNLDRHLKKHEADGPTILDDSPKEAEAEEKDETYFDEIRSFIGKVTNTGSTNGPTPTLLIDGDEDKDRKRECNTQSPRQQSPRSIHSENADVDGLPSGDEDEPMIKKLRPDQVVYKSTSSPPGECKSPDSTRELFQGEADIVHHPSSRNGEVNLAHQKALAYEVMLSLNRKLELSNGIQENGRDEEEEEEEQKEYSEEEDEACEETNGASQETTVDVE